MYGIFNELPKYTHVNSCMCMYTLLILLLYFNFIHVFVHKKTMNIVLMNFKFATLNNNFLLILRYNNSTANYYNRH